MPEADDILEIRTGGVPLRVQRRLPVFQDEIAAQPAAGGESQPARLPTEPQQPAPPPANAPIMASDPSGLTPPPEQATTQWIASTRVYGPGDGFVGRVLSTHYGGTEAATGLIQGVSVERSMVGYAANNDPYGAPVPPASNQPTVGVVSALPFPPRHDQEAYLVTAEDSVLLTTGRDGRRYFLNDELPFIGKITSVDAANSTVDVTRQSLAGDPDDEDFHGATLEDLADSDGDDVDVADVLVLRGALPVPDDNVLVHRRGQYYFVDGQETILVRNDSGSDQARFAVLEIDGPMFSPTENLAAFCNRVGFSGIVPTNAAATGYFVITQTALVVDAIGPATVSGPSVVTIDVETGAQIGFEYAETKLDETGFLVPVAGNSSGTMILWREGGLGEQWAIVRMSNRATLALA